MGVIRALADAARALEGARTLPTGGQPLGSAALRLAGHTPSPLTASPVTREEALSWPALNAGMRIHTGITSQLPLGATSSRGVSDNTRTFLETLDPTMGPGWTCAKTVEALICHAKAYHFVTSRYSDEFPRTIEYVDVELVTEHETTAPDGRRVVDYYTISGDTKRWSPDDVILIPGILPGILQVGAASIRTALANIHAARKYAENPAPHFHLVDAPDVSEPLDKQDALDALDALNTAVTTHGNAYLGGLALATVGWSAKEIQLVEARQQDAIEAARLLNLPTHYVAASTQGASLTYSNQVDVRRDVISSLASFAGMIEQRYSLPDVTPQGTRVKFDAASFYQQVTPTGDTATTTHTPTPAETAL